MNNFYEKITLSKVPLIMGILNVTPDSFSDGGKYYELNSAVDRVETLINEGADIIDIGGESSRPGSEPVPVDIELKRVLPVIEKILENFPNIIISVDTTKSLVAEKSLSLGAKIVNDISCGAFDNRIFEVVAKFEAIFILMHMKGTPKTMQNEPFYLNVVNEISDYFYKKISLLNINGIKNIILDPGIGFGKRVEDNFEIIKDLQAFRKFNFPILIGTSKKSFIGKSLNLGIEERVNATTITETIAVSKGANIIRTHNVKNAIEMKKIFEQMNLLEEPENG